MAAFPKGKSGNQVGGSAKNRVRRAARTQTESCISTLAAVRDDQNAPAVVRLEAATRLLALGYPNFADFMAALGSQQPTGQQRCAA